MEKRFEDKLAVRGAELKAADCPQRIGHRQLVGRGIACETCGSVIPAGPLAPAQWLEVGIAVIGSEPTPTPVSKIEHQAAEEASREQKLREDDLRAAQRIAAEIPKLHEITARTADGEFHQARYSAAKENELYGRIQDLENSAERHHEKARSALIRRAEVAKAAAS